MPMEQTECVAPEAHTTAMRRPRVTWRPAVAPHITAPMKGAVGNGE